MRSPIAWRGSAFSLSRTCCSSCRCATRTARAWCRSARCGRGDRAVVEAEVELTEVVFRGKRQLLSRLSDGSGFLTLRFFHFTASQQAALTRGVRLRCFGDVRRGTLGLEIVHPEYRIARRRRPGAGRIADADVPSDRGRAAGTPASAHRAGAGRLRIQGHHRLAAARGAARARAALAPECARSRAPAAAHASLAQLEAGRAPRAATPGVRRTAGAPTEPETPAPRDPQRSCLAAGGRRRTRSAPAREAAVHIDPRATARGRRDCDGSARTAADAAAGAGRCRLRKDGGRRVRSAASGRSGCADGTHGADGTARRAARAQFRPLVRAPRGARRPADRAAAGTGTLAPYCRALRKAIFRC